MKHLYVVTNTSLFITARHIRKKWVASSASLILTESASVMSERVRTNKQTNKGEMMKVKCVECERVFNLADPTDSEMYAYGHDCEAK